MMKQKKNDLRKQAPIFIVLVSLFFSSLWALDPEKTIDGYLTDKWGITQGLPANQIRSIAQTPDGYLWIATSKDLIRYDGMKFSIAPLAGIDKNNPPKTIPPDTLFLDRTGILWIGNPGGLTSYDCKTGRIKAFPFTGAEEINSDRIRRINDDIKGNLWIGFFKSDMMRFSIGEYTTINARQGLTGKKINAIIEDHKGNLLFGARESGVFIYKDDTFSKYPVKELENAQVISMQEDRKGNLWFGTVNGLFKITGQDTEEYTIANGLMDNHISYIQEDSERNLWIGTVKGLNRIRRKENKTVQIERFSQSFAVLCIFEDQEKNVWVGTDNDGLIRLKDAKFSSYEPLEAYPGETPTAVFEDRGKDTWIGTLKGKLFHCRGRDIIEKIESPQLAGVGIVSMTEDFEGNLWLGTIDKGIFQRKKGTYTRYTRETTQNGLCDNTVTSIYRDSRNNLWLSTLTGVSIIYDLDGEYVIESFASGDGLAGSMVNNVFEDKARNIWIAADKGLFILPKAFAGDQGGRFSRKEPPLPPEAVLRDISITCIYEDPEAPGVYWVSTDGAGLNRLTIKDRNLISRASYTTAEGMATDHIFQFLEDNDGWFWLMSDSGVLRVNKNELNRFAAKESDNIYCASFGIADGMQSTGSSNKFSRNSVLKTGNGEIWFLTDKGISIVNPGKIRINKTPPPVKIETIFINQVNIALHLGPDAYIFKGISDLSVQFTAPTFLSPEKVKFKYQLKGFDKEWLAVPAGSGNERAAHYQDLAPGAYTFKVIACNTDGVWNETGDSFAFTIKPYFYQTFLFKIICFLILAIIAAAVFYLYKKRTFTVNKNNKEEKKRSPLDSQLADECAAKLTHLMEKEKVYRDADISLQTLAQKISTTPHILSQVLNEKLNRSFPDFINSYRVEEARKIFASPRGAEKKNSAVADEVGFNNLGVFYKAFKKFTGMTPNEYKKKQKPI